MTEESPSRPTDPASPSALSAIRDRDRYRALGRAVSYLMTKPAFARLSFGHWSRILTGQVNRRRYFFVVRGGTIVGFLGWAVTTEEMADRWLDGTHPLKAEDSNAGDCILINAWAANDGAVQRFVIENLRRVGQGKRLLYGKRVYADGRVRNLKVPVSRFVPNHIRTAASAPETAVSTTAERRNAEAVPKERP